MRFSQLLPSGSYYFQVIDLVANKAWNFVSNSWGTVNATNSWLLATSISVGAETIQTADLAINSMFSDTARHSLAVIMKSSAYGGPAPTTDSIVTNPEPALWPLTVCCGMRVADDAGAMPFTVDVTCDLDNSGGTSMHLTAELVFNGQTINLASLDPSAICTFTVTQDATATAGSRVSQFSIPATGTGGVGAANSSSRFEAEFPNPNLTANRGFTCVATITTGSVTYSGSCKFLTF